MDLVTSISWPEIRTLVQDRSLQIGLFGPPGVGKTYSLFESVTNLTVPRIEEGKKVSADGADVEGRYVGKVQFHSELAPAEVMGMHVPDGDKFRWEAGPGDLAYAKGGLLILDEVDQASGPMKTYLLGLLDRGPGGTISYVGRTFTQAEGYQAVATMNDRPDNGALPEAVLDRFDAWIFVKAPSPEQLQLLDPDLRQACIEAYEEAVDPLRGPDVTFRMLWAIQKLRKHLPLEKAVAAACRSDAEMSRALYEVLLLTDPEEE